MKIYPAIDLRKGRCVRLRQGRAEDETVYSENPVEMALEWQRKGAEFLHLVDLDGAFEAHPVHTPLFEALSKRLSIPFEVGGGLRTDGDVETVLAAGAERVILGSRAISDPACIARLVARFGGGRIVLGIDARDGFVQIDGWRTTSSVRATDLAQQLASSGVKTVIYTDTATDGMMTGPNLQAVAALADAVPQLSIVASGGVHAPEDVTALAALHRPNIEGVIIGKALYEAPDSLAAFLEAARQ